MATIAAPSPHPPNMKRPPVAMPISIGRYHRWGLWVGCSPRNSPASMGGGAYGRRRPPPVPFDPRTAFTYAVRMVDTPWLGDTCSLVDAFRAGERSPVEELEATLTAIEASELNAFTHLDPERARAA